MKATITKLPTFSLGEPVRIKRADMSMEWVVLFRSWTQLSSTEGEFYLEGFRFDTDERPIVLIRFDRDHHNRGPAPAAE